MNLSKHFQRSELECRCHCGACEIKPELLAALEATRAVRGLPLNVASGYRCPAHNAAVGGAPGSKHLTGEAADIWIAGVDAFELFRIMGGIPAWRGLGLDEHRVVDAATGQKGFVHGDVSTEPPARNLARVTRWRYRDGVIMPWVAEPEA